MKALTRRPQLLIVLCLTCPGSASLYYYYYNYCVSDSTWCVYLVIPIAILIVCSATIFYSVESFAGQYFAYAVHIY